MVLYDWLCRCIAALYWETFAIFCPSHSCNWGVDRTREQGGIVVNTEELFHSQSDGIAFLGTPLWFKMAPAPLCCFCATLSVQVGFPVDSTPEDKGKEKIVSSSFDKSILKEKPYWQYWYADNKSVSVVDLNAQWLSQSQWITAV